MRMLLTVFILFACALATPLALKDDDLYPPPTSYTPTGPNCFWPGWKGIRHLVTFGDSYSQTGFETNGTQPGPGNPFGNPPYPGWPATNGPGWIDFLAAQYNTSFIEVINLAYGGATVDSALVAQYKPDVQSLKNQVQDEFLPIYGRGTSSFPWKASDTLFGIWIGINDMGGSYYTSDTHSLNDKILSVYTSMVELLYNAGARNFVFLNVPPTQRSPSITMQGSWAVDTLKADIADFNSRVSSLAANLTKTHSDAKTILFDTYSLFDNALTKPCAYVETCAIKNTTEFCDAYNAVGPGQFGFDASCGVPADEYFWLNGLHPTWRVHQLVAAKVAARLQSEAPC